MILNGVLLIKYKVVTLCFLFLSPDDQEFIQQGEVAVEEV
jgi:hypothetical protein